MQARARGTGTQRPAQKEELSYFPELDLTRYGDVRSDDDSGVSVQGVLCVGTTLAS